ncbi:MAG: DsrE family protein [Campylobacterales bacterium]|nr:DsrE family protein [Campylobacterales bacterium]
MKKLIVFLALAAMLFGEMKSRYATPHPNIEHPRRVVFQFGYSDEKSAVRMINYIVNLQKAYEPGHIDLAVVCLNDGIFLIKKDTPLKDRVLSLMEWGVEFIACENTMNTRKLTKNDMLDDIGYTKAGMQEIIERKLSGWINLVP